MRRQIVDRVNAALKYEKIAEAPEKVIYWRMKTLLDRQCRVSQFKPYSTPYDTRADLDKNKEQEANDQTNSVNEAYT
jgi:hypothetical protein